MADISIALDQLLSNVEVKKTIGEAAIAVAIQRMLDQFSDTERDLFIDYLEQGNTEAAAEMILERDAQLSEVDLEQRVQDLCEELDGCTLPSEQDPHIVAESAEDQLDLQEF